MSMEYIRFLHLESYYIMCLMSLSAFIWGFVFSVTPLSAASEHFYLLPSQCAAASFLGKWLLLVER